MTIKKQTKEEKDMQVTVWIDMNYGQKMIIGQTTLFIVPRTKAPNSHFIIKPIFKNHC